MKKRFVSAGLAALLVCLLVAQTALAATPRAAGATYDLSFEGNTAVCTAICKGNSTSDNISATMLLYEDGVFVDSWSGSGKWKVTLSGEYPAVSGKTYRLAVSYSVNNLVQPIVSTTATCP